MDLSPAAVAYTRRNAAAHGCGDRVRVVQGSWGEPLLKAGQQGCLGGLLSNPPYIPEEEMGGLQAEVGLHEPRSALAGGAGPGLDSLQVICRHAKALLMPGGFLALEVRVGRLLGWSPAAVADFVWYAVVSGQAQCALRDVITHPAALTHCRLRVQFRRSR